MDNLQNYSQLSVRNYPLLSQAACVLIPFIFSVKAVSAAALYACDLGPSCPTSLFLSS